MYLTRVFNVDTVPVPFGNVRVGLAFGIFSSMNTVIDITHYVYPGFGWRVAHFVTGPRFLRLGQNRHCNLAIWLSPNIYFIKLDVPSVAIIVRVNL